MLAWGYNKGDHNTDKVLLISPGLLSTSKSNYIQTVVANMHKRGYKCVLIVNRGLEVPLLTPRAYCATHTIDLSHAISQIKIACPNAKLYATGFSLGGVILANYLSMAAENSGVEASFICSSPFNTVAASRNLEKWNNWLLYGYVLTQKLKQFYYKSRDMFRNVVDHNAIMSCNSIRQFDSLFTIKTFGYDTADQYYEAARLTEVKIMRIKTPLLWMYADDDAFIPDNSTPCDTIMKCDYVALAVTSSGGHVAHLQGKNPLAKPYYVDMMMQFIEAVHNVAFSLFTCVLYPACKNVFSSDIEIIYFCHFLTTSFDSLT